MPLEPEIGGIHDEVKTVAICVFPNHDAAQVAASNLEARGISTWITSDDAGGMLPNLATPGGVRLSVRESDAEQAIALLNLPARREQSESETMPAVSTGSSVRRKFAPVQFLAGVVLGVLLYWGYLRLQSMGTWTNYCSAHGRHVEAWLYRNGNLAEFWQDRNFDGTWDYWVYYEDHLVTRTEEDNNFDGKPDETWFYSNGEPTRMERDTDFNGIPDEFCTFKNHLVQILDIRPNGSKFSTHREFFNNGVLTEMWSGGDSNGVFKSVIRYDPFMNPISTNEPSDFKLTLPGSK